MQTKIINRLSELTVNDLDDLERSKRAHDDI